MNNPYADIMNISVNQSTPAQEALKKSLVQMLDGTRMSDISIKELCKHAFIARSTFYAYYNNLDEVLEDIENEILYQLIHMNSQLMDRRVKETGEMFFYSETLSMIEEHRATFYTLLVSNPDYRFIGQWKQAMKYHFWERLKPGEEIKNTELVFELTASAAIGAYTFWLTHPYEVDVSGTYKILSDILSALDRMS